MMVIVVSGRTEVERDLRTVACVVVVVVVVVGIGFFEGHERRQLVVCAAVGLSCRRRLLLLLLLLLLVNVLVLVVSGDWRGWRAGDWRCFEACGGKRGEVFGNEREVAAGVAGLCLDFDVWVKLAAVTLIVAWRCEWMMMMMMMMMCARREGRVSGRGRRRDGSHRDRLHYFANRMLMLMVMLVVVVVIAIHRAPMAGVMMLMLCAEDVARWRLLLLLVRTRRANGGDRWR